MLHATNSSKYVTRISVVLHMQI